MNTSNEISAMEHPYWTEVLALPSQGKTNPILQIVPRASKESRKKILQLVHDGFGPISHTSPLSFRRVATLSPSKNARKYAQKVYEIELGKHPLVPGTSHQNIPHTEQFQRMMESLENGITIEPISPRNNLLQRLSLPSASLTQALAICDVIEHIAPEIIYRLQDFVAQWQVSTGRESKKINRVFLDEHSLTEGGESPDQHIGIVESIVKEHPTVARSPLYDQEKKKYHAKIREHLDDICARLRLLLIPKVE